MTTKRLLLLTALLCAATLAPAPARAANALVGTGTPASCTEASFAAALSAVLGGGTGTITFSCGGPATITFGAEQRIETVNGRDPDVTIDGGGQITLSGGGSVALFTVYGSPTIPTTLRLRNITLTDGQSAGDGGAIFNSGGALILEQTTIQNSVSAAAGGAIASLDGSVTLLNSTLRGNRAASYGGGLNSRGALSITGSVIQANQVDGSAGNCNGGGMAVLGTIAIASSQIISNTASSQSGRGGKGGGICFDSGSLRVSQVRLAGNAAVEGGALASLGTATIADSQLLNNSALGGSAGGAGGALWSGGTTLLTDTLVADNRSFDGGGVYQSTSGSLSLTRVTVAGNSASGVGGGGVYVRGAGLRAGLGTGRATIRASQIRDNRANYFGGGVFNNGGSVTIAQTELLRNQTTAVPPLGFSGGGGVYAANAYLELQATTLRQNQSASGGGGLAVGDSLTENQQLNNVSVVDSTFDGNGAVSSGGAIAVWQSAGQTPIPGSDANVPALTIARSTLSANTSGQGGAIYNGNVVSANNVTFASNQAASGGALFSDARANPALATASYLSYATFVGNRADSSGSALFAASGALITLRGSVLANGLVSQHCAGSLRPSGSNRASDNSCGLALLLDPQLGPLAANGGPTATFLPAANSPLLNAETCITALTTDQRGRPRPFGPACDIGAVERQRDEGLRQVWLPQIATSGQR